MLASTYSYMQAGPETEPAMDATRIRMIDGTVRMMTCADCVWDITTKMITPCEDCMWEWETGCEP